MTNREKLLEEIGKLTDRQLFDFTGMGYHWIEPEKDLGFVVCDDCRARNCGDCIRELETEDCVDIEEAWMGQECRHERLLEVEP